MYQDALTPTQIKKNFKNTRLTTINVNNREESVSEYTIQSRATQESNIFQQYKIHDNGTTINVNNREGPVSKVSCNP